MILNRAIREATSGNGARVGVVLRRHLDKLTLLDAQSNGQGWYRFELNGCPGPVYAEIQASGVTRYHSTRTSGPLGAGQLGEIGSWLRSVYGNGVIAGEGNMLAVRPGNDPRRIEVLPGLALAGGIAHRQNDTDSFVLTENETELDRYDLIVVGAHPLGHAEEGKTAIYAREGVPGGGVPAPEVSTVLVETPLASVKVKPGQQAFAVTNITDRREWCLTGTALRHPVAVAIGRRVDTTAISITGETIAPTSFVLATNVTYDTRFSAQALINAGSTSPEVGIAPLHNDNFLPGETLPRTVAQTLRIVTAPRATTLVGNGGSEAFAIYVFANGPGAVYRTAHLLVAAVPRS